MAVDTKDVQNQSQWEQEKGQSQTWVLVSPATRAGEHFMQLLKVKGILYAAIVNNYKEKSRLERLGNHHVWLLDTQHPKEWIKPDQPIGNVYLFEQSLPVCCRYIQMCREWTKDSLYVITESDKSRKIYRGLGADHIIHTSSCESVAYLL